MKRASKRAQQWGWGAGAAWPETGCWWKENPHKLSPAFHMCAMSHIPAHAIHKCFVQTPLTPSLTLPVSGFIHSPSFYFPPRKASGKTPALVPPNDGFYAVGQGLAEQWEPVHTRPMPPAHSTTKAKPMLLVINPEIVSGIPCRRIKINVFKAYQDYVPPSPTTLILDLCHEDKDTNFQTNFQSIYPGQGRAQW